MKKQVMFSMRLNRDMKLVLEDLAKTEKHSLSSLVENILDEYLKENQIEWEHQEKRGRKRKVINMPARFQVRGNYIPEVQNVLIQDISQTGVFTIFNDVDGIENILKRKGISIEARLIINIPNFKEPIFRNCEGVRISLNRQHAGIGLEYNTVRAWEQSLINETLLAGGF
jgi:hypothetical protein